MLFWTKVGQYTEEEFGTAFGQFKTSNKPFIFTYFKSADISISSANNGYSLRRRKLDEGGGAWESLQDCTLSEAEACCV
jgi:hypothetical protein